MPDKKLRKKLRKLCKWAKKHGYEHVDLFAIAPNDEHEDEWYANFFAPVDGGEDVTYFSWFKEAEL